MTSTTDPVLLRIRTVCEITSLSKATIYRLTAAGAFPQPLHVTPRCTRWRSDEVAAWLSRATGQGNPPKPASSGAAAP